MPAQRRVDWHSVLEDFAYLGLTGDELGTRIGLRPSLLQRIATGACSPAPCAADRLAALWCELLSKSEEFLPRTVDQEGTPREEIRQLESNEPAPQSYVEVEAITMTWAQIVRRSQVG